MRTSHEGAHEGHEPGRSRRALQAVRSQVRPGSFPMLLVAMVLHYLLNAVTVGTTASLVLVQVAHGGVVAAGIYVLRIRRSTTWVAVAVFAIALAVESGLWSLDPRVDRLALDAITTAFLAWVLAVVLREVFRPTTSERDAVIGALCGFLIILTVFMRLHCLVEAFSPGAYHLDGSPLSERPPSTQVATFQYFSTITLTTVGFGDIVPVTEAARLATGLEAIVGQVYLAVVIATLVSRVAARRA